MSGKNLFKIILGTIIVMLDFIVANAFDYFMMLFNAKSAVMELSNSDEAYMASHIFQIQPWMFYIVLIAINILLICLIFGPSKSKKKVEDKEENQ